ncbi:MAG: GAF domain-containing protein [Nitrospirae bacterium]|nr:GAF domain-containing protein [Nitrospirota bacterium]
MGVRYYTQGKWLLLLHPLLGLLLPGFAQLKLIERYRQSKDEWRKKCFFMLLGAGTGFLGGWTTYLMTFDIPIFPWGVPLVALYPPLLSYAIIRYRLINIQTVIHKTLLWAAMSSLVLAPLFGILWLTRPWLETLPTWGVSLFALGLFYLTTVYYQTIQPKIDHLFQRRKYDLQQVLDHLLQRLAVLGNIRELSRQILHTLVETVYAKQATLLLSDEKTQSYHPLETAGEASGIQLPVDDPFIEWLRHHPGIIEAEVIDQEPAYAEIKEAAKAFFHQTGSVVCVPLSTGHEFVGLIHLGTKTNLKPYTDPDLKFLEKLRVEAAIALSNATLYDRVMKLNTELTGLNTQLEEKVQDRTAELEKANRKLTDSNQKIAEADRMKSKFLTNMSHELRTPLNSIIGFSRVLLKGVEGPLTDQQRADLEAIYKSGQHLLGLISDLLDLSKIEAGKMDLHVEEVELGELVQGVLSTAQALAAGKAIELKREVRPGLPKVWGDGMRLRQVILNLVSNAIKFTDRGEVEVRVEQRGSYVVVNVRDTGCGIRMEDQGKLFEEFRQLDGGRQRGGTGLGLAISKRFVELHGGEIWVESRVGEGSTFAFSLPVKKQSGVPVSV